MKTFREELVNEIALCEKKLERANTEIAVQNALVDLYADQKTMLYGLLIQYDKEHPDERKESENNAAD